MGNEFEFHAQKIEGGVLTVQIKGNIRTDDAMQDLREVVDGAMQTSQVNLVLDMEQVRFIDSAGLGFLLLLNGLVKGAGNHMVALRPKQAVAKIFDYTCLAELIPVFESTSDAKAHFNSKSGG